MQAQDAIAHKIIIGPNAMKGNLYLGSFHATTFEELDKLKIKAVITAMMIHGIDYDGNITHLVIEADDFHEYDISQHFKQTNEFIEKELQNTNILVHCLAGISRSATVVAAYLMKKQGLSSEQAIKFIQSKRKIVKPNVGFVKQLKQYETTKK